MGTPTFQCLQPKMLLPLHFSFSHNHHHSVKDASSLPSKCIQKLCAEDHSALLHGYHQNRGSGPPLPEWLQQDPNWSSCCSPLPLSPLVPLPLCLSSSCLTHQHSCHWVSVQFSPSVMSDSLRPHGLQHARPPSPSPTPGVYSNSCPLGLGPNGPNQDDITLLLYYICKEAYSKYSYILKLWVNISLGGGSPFNPLCHPTDHFQHNSPSDPLQNKVTLLWYSCAQNSLMAPISSREKLKAFNGLKGPMGSGSYTSLSWPPTVQS